MCEKSIVERSAPQAGMGRFVRARLLKPYDRFPRLGIAEGFASQALDGFGIVVQRVDRALQLPGSFFFLLDLGIQAQDGSPHRLILLDEGKIPDRQPENPGHERRPTRVNVV